MNNPSHCQEMKPSTQDKTLLYLHGGGGLFGSPENEINIQFVKHLHIKYKKIHLIRYKLFWERNYQKRNIQIINNLLKKIGNKYDVVAVSAGAYIFMNSLHELHRMPQNFYGVAPMLSKEGTVITQLISAIGRIRLSKEQKENQDHLERNIIKYTSNFNMNLFIGKYDRIIEEDVLYYFCNKVNCELHIIEGEKHRLLDNDYVINKILE